MTAVITMTIFFKPAADPFADAFNRS